jgi:hypothetical protein
MGCPQTRAPKGPIWCQPNAWVAENAEQEAEGRLDGEVSQKDMDQYIGHVPGCQLSRIRRIGCPGQASHGR